MGRLKVVEKKMRIKRSNKTKTLGFFCCNMAENKWIGGKISYYFHCFLKFSYFVEYGSRPNINF